ncbi:MAG: HlyD family efflux transporter periplasmic adaptor subunit, partial [Granulosicoccus sp.]|nr:HlyD family efflux transporter periplasmic adaptor subunit [Granulosicoccus sp.]
MNKRLRKWLISALVVIAVLALGVAWLRPAPVSVETAVLSRGSLSIAVEERGRTRASQRYSVAAPVSGQLLRTDVHVGQRVEQGETLARIAPPPEDQRTVATARAELAAAQARQRETEALLQEARSTLARARSEATRRTELYDKGLISIETRDQYAQNADAARARLASAEASVAAATAQVQSARSRLLGVDSE